MANKNAKGTKKAAVAVVSKKAAVKKVAAPKAKRLTDDTKVIIGAPARKATLREQIQGFAKHAITVVTLVERIKKVPNARGKVRDMLAHGLLKAA